MIDRYLRHSWPADVLEALGRFKQGDLIERPPFFYGVTPGMRLWSPDDEDDDPEGQENSSQVEELHPEDSPAFGIVTTQTCDIVEQATPTRPWLQVSPVYRLDEIDPKDRQRFLSKASIVELTGPDLPQGRWVADLRLEMPLEKTVLVGRETIAGFATEEEAEGFGGLLGRRRARAALADELVESVIRLIGKRKRNNQKLTAAVWNELYKLGLQIEQGSRMKPVAVRLHVISMEEPNERVKSWFQAWEDQAREEAAAVDITLHTTRHHDSRSMDIKLADRLIDLEAT